MSNDAPRTACLLIPNLPLAAELRAHPELGGEPLAVASGPGPRAEIIAISAEAARRGVLGTAAEVAIELAPAQTRFTGTPVLLEGLDVQVNLVRHRNAPGPRHTTVRLRATQAA